MTDDSANPGAAAILLLRDVTADDSKEIETEYRRIKVLTDEGKKYGDVEIPYDPEVVQIEGIQARTVRPDGTATTFQGQIFERTVVRIRKSKLQLKAFTLPDVQKGSIVEYSYTVRPKPSKSSGFYFNGFDTIVDRTYVTLVKTWQVREDLFTKHARFAVRQYESSKRYFYVRNIPVSTTFNDNQDGWCVVEISNVPAFQSEEKMPAEDVARGFITFFVQRGLRLSNLYWEQVSHSLAKYLAPNWADPKKVKRHLAGLVSPTDSPETRLRQIYARVQKVRNLDYDPVQTQQEAKRQHLKESNSVEDVLKRNYGFGEEIDFVFVALLKAAGFEAAPLLVRSRDRGAFDPEYPVLNQLDAWVVWVEAAGKNYFLDPATRYCPFGTLPWAKSGTAGIALTVGASLGLPKNTSTQYSGIVNTPPLVSTMAILERKATMTLDKEGNAEGRVMVKYWGQEALARRIAGIPMDETKRHEVLEEELKTWLPGATVKLDRVEDWENQEAPIRAEFIVKVPGFATSTGRRFLFRSALFNGGAQPFKSPTRMNPVYFNYPAEERDNVAWSLPEGFHVSGRPENQERSTLFGNFAFSTEESGVKFETHRHFTTANQSVAADFYAALRSYYNSVRVNDESQIVIEITGGQNAAK